MNIKKNILLVCILFAQVAMYSQTIEGITEMKPSQLLGFAKNAVKIGDTYSAIEFYKQYITLKSDDHESAYALAELYRITRDYEHAQDLYLKIYESNSELYPLALFYYAQMLKFNGNYNDAIAEFQRFKKEQRKVDIEIKNKLKNELAGCKLAQDIIDLENADKLYEIKHLNTSINSAHVDFAPLQIAKEKMIYASLKSDTIPVHKPNEGPLRKFYAAFRDEGEWYHAGEHIGPFNRSTAHVGNGALSPEGSRFYFTVCEPKLGKKPICDIWVSENEKGNWMEPYRLEEINDPEFTTTQPAVGKTSKEREVLYFISDREGGKGGLDIWFSVYDRKKARYSRVRNAGSKINTKGDEMTPFVDVNTNTLYFSSDGWPSIGGLDVFKTDGEETRWLPPINVGFPLNSSADELYFTVNPYNAKEGFVVSNRKGGIALKSPTCCDDIYSYKQTGSKNVTLLGKVYDVDYVEKILAMDESVKDIEGSIENERLLISNQTVTVYEVAGDGEERILIKELKTDSKGEFSLELERNKRYEAVVIRKGYFSKYHEFVTKSIKGDEITQHLGLLILTKDPIVVKNIYYPFNESYLTDEAKETIDTSLYKILIQNPSIIIEILSHTDSKGQDDYNLRLSQARAESVVKYLIEKGIDKKRLSSKGYGETKPIARNENTDGSDNPDGRAMNRRTEFRVTGSLDKETEIIYSK